MDSLYVCHFSNGHIKVGRSIDPTARIAAHADRVACAGIELVAHHIVACDKPAGMREAYLISLCTDAAAERFKNEWFSGLDYPTVCEWADAAALWTGTVPAQSTPWRDIITELRLMGLTQMELAGHCGVNQSAISELLTGKTTDPRYSTGASLLALHAMYYRKAA